MSKFDEILNSSNASDALLGEQIDAITNGLKEIPVKAETTEFVTYFTDTSVTAFFNESIKKTTIVLNGKAKTAIPKKIFALGYFDVDNISNILPKALILNCVYVETPSGTIMNNVYLSKNAANKYIAFINNDTDSIPAGSVVVAQLEYTCIS